MKKLLLTFVFMLVTATTVWAQTDTQRLVVWQKSGEKVYFDLTEEPETTFEDGQLVINTNKTTIYYQLENILRYTYEGMVTAIDSPKTPANKVVFRQGKDQMSFDGLAEGTLLCVYAIDGKLLSTQTARGGQTAVISLASQPAGTYILKVGDATYKFFKK